ncbi:39808_t:CDS:2 [Gigaspora margarita]|uniref:39808_t:CDS:1 n=1 Tax=Gigaspora margarita TaxID=4874 RepID=A0ABM8VXL9_GIGMA|nr:39808_t:CDS:2 [Gigaspora margarita]
MSYQGTPQMTTTGAQFVQEKAGVPGQPRQWKFGLCDCLSDCGTDVLLHLELPLSNSGVTDLF